MKAIYNLVTFLAAVVILATAGWCTYLHRDTIKNVFNGNCICVDNCACGDKCKCDAEKRCAPACSCK